MHIPRFAQFAETDLDMAGPHDQEHKPQFWCVDCEDVEVFVFESRCPACQEIARAKLDQLVPVRACSICNGIVMANHEAAACENCNTPYPVPDYLNNSEAPRG